MPVHVTPYAGGQLAAPPVDAQRAERPADAEPELLRWEGQPQGWWSRHGSSVGIGAAAGGTAAFIATMVTIDSLRFTGSARGMLIGGAALGVGLLGVGIAALTRRGDDRIGDLPSGPVPRLAAPVAPKPVHGGEQAPGTHLGHGEGSYTEQVPVTRTRVGADGQVETYTEYETQWRYFDWDVQLREPVGRRDGWPSVDAAVSELSSGDAVALRRQDGRVVAYDLSDRSHWSDLDSLRVDDRSTEAVVTPSGTVWERARGDQFARTGRVDRPDPTGVHGRSIGEYEVRHRGNPDIPVGMFRTANGGLPSAGEAIGLAQHLPGDQVVLDVGSRFHVADVASPQLDRRLPNDGLATTEHAGRVVMLEQQGGRWAPLDGWYVRPEES